jgi:hypothetical protein
MEEIVVKSEAADSVGYDKVKRILRIRFTSGRIYEYMQVPFLCFMEMMEADSVGQYINWKIKPNFPYRVVQEWT